MRISGVRPLMTAATLGAAFAVFLASAPAAAAAQDGCPPGMTRIAGTGANGQAMNCIPLYDPGGAPDTISADELAASYAPRPDREVRVLEDVIGEMRRNLAQLRAQYEAAGGGNAPRVAPAAPTSPGRWKVFQNGGNNVPAGQYCTAMFSNAAGMVILSGPGGSFRGALLQFIAPGIPRQAGGRNERVSVTLAQTGDERPQTVRAYMYSMPGVDSGMLTLAVPTIEAALDAMLDAQFLRAWVNGQPAVDINWTGGHAARDRMRQCLSGTRMPDPSRQ